MTPKAPRTANSFRGSLTGEDLTSQLEPFDDFANFSDEDLERVTKEWRARAARGERDAFGIAHDCEVELRRRQRDSDATKAGLVEPAETRVRTKWWQRWLVPGRSGDGT